MADYLVGTDIGTGGTKSVLIDGEGNVLGSHYIEYPLPDQAGLNTTLSGTGML